ncbi:MAG: hypothetical protein RIS70_878 [Planctomycetota bacterium]
MNKNLLDQLAREPVPPPPRSLPVEVHRRINERLVTQHLMDFVVRALPTALLEFLLALLNAIWYSMLGTDWKTNRNSPTKGTDQ